MANTNGSQCGTVEGDSNFGARGRTRSKGTCEVAGRTTSPKRVSIRSSRRPRQDTNLHRHERMMKAASVGGLSPKARKLHRLNHLQPLAQDALRQYAIAPRRDWLDRDHSIRVCRSYAIMPLVQVGARFVAKFFIGVIVGISLGASVSAYGAVASRAGTLLGLTV
jgi:hypothetical protein